MRIDDEVISGILFADTDSESGAEASARRWTRRRRRTTTTTTAATSLSRERTRGCKVWWITNLGTASEKEHFIHPFVGPAKCVKKSEAPHIHTDSFPPFPLLMLFLRKVFSCWWNRPTYITSNTQTDKPDLSALVCSGEWTNGAGRFSRAALYSQYFILCTLDLLG
jgi:hypothetical protein